MQKFYSSFLLFVCLLTGNDVLAQFPYFNSFRTSSIAGITLGESAKLTSGSPDPVNDGVLRLTENNFDLKGYCLLNQDFSVSQGLKVEFEYFTYGGNNADGTAFFLYEPSGAFELGQKGGSLGYAQSDLQSGTILGLKGGFLGIGLDEYGNFGVIKESKSGGFIDGNGNLIPDVINSDGAISVRGGVGPNGERTGPTAYPFIGGKITGNVWNNPKPHSSQVVAQEDYFPISTDARYTNETAGGYRRVRLDIERKVGVGFVVNVEIFVGSKQKWIKVLDNVTYAIADSRVPLTLRGGFSASTGSQRNYHEIRNVLITPSAKVLASPTANNDAKTILSNQSTTVTALANDIVNANTSGVFQASSFDLDPTTIAVNNSYTVSGKGTFTVDANGLVTFTPENNFVGVVTANYTFKDNYNITSTTGTITITVNSPNTAPTVADISKSGPEDATITFTANDFTSKFTDVNAGDVLTKIKVVNLPANGTLKLSGVNITANQEIPAAQLANITFDPTANWNGNTTFKWNGFDGTVYSATDANVNITITPVNDAPGVGPIGKTGPEDVTVTFTSADFTSKFTDIDGDPLTKIQVVTLPNNGTLKLSGVDIISGQEIPVAQLANITFVPSTNWNGSTSFNWNGHDGSTYAAASATVSIVITPVNDLPVVTAIVKSGNEDTAIPFTAADFTSKFTDIDNDVLSKIRITSLPANGLLKLSGVNITINQEIATAQLANITFVPNINWNGSTSFNWNGNDGTAYAAADAPVNITVTPVNDLPTVSAISKAGPEDVVLTFSATDFTDKFSDPENDALTKIRISSLPQNGVLRLAGVNIIVNQEVAFAQLANLTFTPNADWNGNTSFNWNGHDGVTYAAVDALVNITITPVNDLPVVSAISKAGNEDQVLTFASVDFTSKFADPDGNSLTKIRVSSLPANGILKLGGVNIALNQEIPVAQLATITFTPNANWNGNTSFNWNGNDGSSYATLDAPVNITITAVNDLPTVASIAKSGNEDVVVNFTSLDFTSKFTDIENDPLSKIRITSLPANGTLRLSGVNISVNQEIPAAQLADITFTPNANWNGSTMFNWNGHDGTAYALADAPVNITVSPVPDLPVVSAIVKTGTEDNPLVFTVADFTSKFADPDGDILSRIKVNSLPVNGTLKLSGVDVLLNQEIPAAQLASITFVPNANWNGATSFNWNGHDGTSYAVADAPVNITISAVNDLPTVAAISKSGTEDVVVPFAALDFTSKFTDIDNDALSKIKIVSLPANGVLKLNGTDIILNQEIIVAQLANITFVPATNWNGSTSFKWNGHDGTAYALVDAPVNITLTATDDLPVVAAITKSGTEDTPVTFAASDFTSKFNDPDLDLLTKIKIASLPINGTLKLSGANISLNQEIPAAQLANITFEPAANWNGTASFNWNGHDGNNYAIADASVTITIAPANDLPEVAAITKAGTEDVAVTFAAVDFTSKFTDIDNDALFKIRIASLPLNGTLKLNGVNITLNQEVPAAQLANITFVPNGNWNGSTTFNWNGNDGTAYAAVDAPVNITITALNDLPVVSAVPKAGTEDSPVTFTTTDFTTKFNDPDGDILTKIKITSLPINGTLKLNGVDVSVNQEIPLADIPNLTFTPNADWNGNTTFNWNGNDGAGYALVDASVNITINPVADLPVVAAVPKTGTEDTPVTFTALDFTSKFADPDGDALNKIKVISLPINGALKLSGVNISLNQEIPAAQLPSITFVPDVNWSGNTTFNWNGFDGLNYAAADAPVNITINAANDLPTVAAITKSGTEDVTIGFTALDFTSKFTDIDNDALSKVKIASLPANGVLKLNGVDITLNQEVLAAQLASITFVPTTNWNGTTSFNWNGHDGTAYALVEAPVTITLTAAGDLPVVAAIAKTGIEDVPVAFTALDFTSKFSDPDGDQLNKIKITSLPQNGTLKLSGAVITLNQEVPAAQLASITFEPTTNWSGSSAFNWNGYDGSNYALADAPVTITLSAANDLPTVAAIAKTGTEDATVAFAPIDFTSKFTDIDNDALSKIKIASLPLNGILKLSGVNITLNQEIPAAQLANITFVPNGNWNGSTTFNWNGNDGTAYAVVDAPVNITIIALNDLPVVSAVPKAGTEDSPVTFTTADFTTKFNDPDGDILTKIKITSLPINGTLKLNGVDVSVNQEIPLADIPNLTFTPNADWNGNTTFNWNGNDGSGYALVDAPVSITIAPTNDKPLVADFEKTTAQGQELSFTSADFGDNFADLDGDNLAQIQITELPAKGILKYNGVAVTVGQVILFVDLSKLSFDPLDLTASTTFKWKGHDGTDYSTNESVVTINVIKASNPIATNDKAEADLNKDIKIPILDNDKADASLKLDVGSIEILNDPISGTIKINADGTITYTPNKGFVGTDEFTYTVKDDAGNISNVAVVTIVVKGFVLPNTFTPNGDGINDTFVILGRENYDVADLTIFNRWGNEVYRNANYQDTWDGESLNSGTYYFIVKLKKGATEDIRKGWVLIKR